MSKLGSTDWKETVAPDESARFERHAATLRELQAKRARGGKLDRALHSKPHVGVTGELVVPSGLREELRVATFAEPRTWPLYVRFSNGHGGRQPDGVADVRGIALKLVGVPGRKIIPGLEGKHTQDFLLIQVQTSPFRNPDEFMALVRAAAGGKALLLPRLVRGLGLGRTLSVVKALAGMHQVTSMAAVPFFSAAPIRFGAMAAKLALFPVNPAPASSSSSAPDALRDDLLARLRGGPLTWSLRAQFFADERSTPIEDSSVPWTEAQSPFHELARLVIPKQDVASARGAKVEEYIEQMSFDPWHAVEELRPLGAIMRARAVAYRESVIARKAAPEPDEMASFD